MYCWSFSTYWWRAAREREVTQAHIDWLGLAQLQKPRRFLNAFSDPNRGRWSFSSPLHPYPPALGPMPIRGSSADGKMPASRDHGQLRIHYDH
jgi:hypothetical protein